MMTRTDSPPPEPGAAQDALGHGVYDAGEAVRLLNFHRDATPVRRVQTRTLYRWMRGYDYVAGDETRHAAPLWEPDYAIGNRDAETPMPLEISSRDLIELRFDAILGSDNHLTFGKQKKPRRAIQCFSQRVILSIYQFDNACKALKNC